MRQIAPIKTDKKYNLYKEAYRIYKQEFGGRYSEYNFRRTLKYMKDSIFTLVLLGFPVKVFACKFVGILHPVKIKYKGKYLPKIYYIDKPPKSALNTIISIQKKKANNGLLVGMLLDFIARDSFRKAIKLNIIEKIYPYEIYQ